MSDYDSILIEREGRVARVSFNRPDKLNSFNGTMRREFVRAAQEVNADNDIWVDDEGLLAPGVSVARIGRAGRVPLPAYVVGLDGEACTDTTLSLATIEAMTTWTMTEPKSA